MTARAAPRVLSIPAGAPFLPTLASALLDGRLVEGFSHDRDPLALADVTIYVPTRRAARALRGVFVDRLGGTAAILPTIRPLGEFDDDDGLLDHGDAGPLELVPPIDSLERILLLAPLVREWKKRLPAHVAGLFGEDVVVPASLADAIWLSRDLADLMDEIETHGADWSSLARLVPEDLASWWQVTLRFLGIVTEAWPALLAERDRSNPAAHRDALIRAEAERLARTPPAGPVVAAGSTGSIPATAQLLAAISRLPRGAVVLPGLDLDLDGESWAAIGEIDGAASTFGHPQAALKRLLPVLGVDRGDVEEIGSITETMRARMRLVSEALRPAETTDAWASAPATHHAALDGVTLVEAANEREEALAIAVALRLAIAEEGRSAALVTGDRELARRVAVELRRFGIEADDSGGSPLLASPPGSLLRTLLDVACRPGDAVPIMALLKHPLLQGGMARTNARAAAEAIDLAALRGSFGRPDIVGLREEFDRRLEALESDARKPFWHPRLSPRVVADARTLLDQIAAAVARFRTEAAGVTRLGEIAVGTVQLLEAAGRDEAGTLDELYRGDAGERLARFLRSLVAVAAPVQVTLAEWPDVFLALAAGETVKPSMAGDSRVAIWGALEARLQSVDTLVLGGLNEGSWPRRAEPDRFMSRFMKAGMELEPPEKRIGQAAHDFVMAMGTPNVVLTRGARSGDAPALASRWLQRIETFAGERATATMGARGASLLRWARALDRSAEVPFAPRPRPRPPSAVRPARYSVTEIERLRRDPYAIYAKRILRLEPLETLRGDPDAADRGNLFHDIVHAFAMSGIDPLAEDAEAALLAVGRWEFDGAMLPPEVDAVWWPRFVRMAGEFIGWERGRALGVKQRLSEIRADAIAVGASGATLAGRADRIDLRAGGMADIIDFKTGSSPSKGQAHTLLSPQLALEGALLMRGAFADAGPATPSELAYVRLKANGEVIEQSILEFKGQSRTAPDLAEEAWARLERLLTHFAAETTPYLSRALPFREGDVGGDYDHLARVLEWSAGAEEDLGEGE